MMVDDVSLTGSVATGEEEKDPCYFGFNERSLVVQGIREVRGG